MADGTICIIKTVLWIVLCCAMIYTGKQVIKTERTFLQFASADHESIKPSKEVIYNGLWQLKIRQALSILRAPDATFGMVMPLPHTMSSTQNFYEVETEKLNFQVSGETSPLLQAALDRYRELISCRVGLSPYAHHWSHAEAQLQSLAGKHISDVQGTAGAAPNFLVPDTMPWSRASVDNVKEHFPKEQAELSSLKISNILINVKNIGRDYPSLEMDETYSILVDHGTIFLVAPQSWGAIRGLESISQLMWRTNDYKQVYINQTYIYDQPRFPHRGLMIDTARHYISKSTLLLNLEAMAYNKLNVFHWHLTDDESFPYQSRTYPEFSEEAAFSPNQVYTVDDIREIVEFARLRGIRVIPELDVPGHTRSWGYARPELLSRLRDTYTGQVEFGHLNISGNQTYTVLRGLIGELLELFPDDYIHLGGDEVQTFMGRGTTEKPLSYFWTRVLNILRELGENSQLSSKKLMVWEEAPTVMTEIPQSLISQQWQSSQAMEAVKNVIYSQCWYLDHLNNIRNWAPYYTCEDLEDISRRLKSDQKLLGGEACMWSEDQSDSSILTRIWPVTIGIAERLWSRSSIRKIIQVGPRIEESRCRMISRGVPQGSLLGPGSCTFSGVAQNRTCKG